MPDPVLQPTPAIQAWTPIAVAGLAIDVRDDLTIAGIAPFRGNAQAVADALAARYGLALPAACRRISGDDITLQWSGPDQWIAIAGRGAARDLEVELKPLLAGLAAVVDHSDARAVVVVSGEHARSVLAKGLPIDLHERAFRVGDVAITHANHIGVTITQAGHEPVYEIMLYRSYADSFAGWLLHASKEFTG